jgi:hypothetical protein
MKNRWEKYLGYCEKRENVIKYKSILRKEE